MTHSNSLEDYLQAAFGPEVDTLKAYGKTYNCRKQIKIAFLARDAGELHVSKNALAEANQLRKEIISLTTPDDELGWWGRPLGWGRESPKAFRLPQDPWVMPEKAPKATEEDVIRRASRVIVRLTLRAAGAILLLGGLTYLVIRLVT